MTPTFTKLICFAYIALSASTSWANEAAELPDSPVLRDTASPAPTPTNNPSKAKHNNAMKQENNTPNTVLAPKIILRLGGSMSQQTFNRGDYGNFPTFDYGIETDVLFLVRNVYFGLGYSYSFNYEEDEKIEIPSSSGTPKEVIPANIAQSRSYNLLVDYVLLRFKRVSLSIGLRGRFLQTVLSRATDSLSNNDIRGNSRQLGYGGSISGKVSFLYLSYNLLNYTKYGSTAGSIGQSYHAGFQFDF